MTIDELADRVAEWEAQRAATQSPPDRRRIREELHDVDLPALDDRGVVTFNADEGIVGDGGRDFDRGPVREAVADADAPVPPGRAFGRARLAAAVAVALSAVVLTAVVLGEAVAATVVGGLVVLGLAAAVAVRLARVDDAA